MIFSKLEDRPRGRDGVFVSPVVSSGFRVFTAVALEGELWGCGVCAWAMLLFTQLQI